MDDWNSRKIIIAPSSVLVKVGMDTQSKKYGAKHKYVTQRSDYSWKDIIPSTLPKSIDQYQQVKVFRIGRWGLGAELPVGAWAL
jgi:hypothetical protein